MAPPLAPLVQEKKEDDSTSKFVTGVQYNTPPSSDDVMKLNRQFKT